MLFPIPLFILNLLQSSFPPTTFLKLLLKGTQDLHVAKSSCQSLVLILHDVSAAWHSWSLHPVETLLYLASKTPSCSCLSGSSFSVLCAGSSSCPQPLNTGDSIQSHCFKKHLMLTIPKFTYPAQTSLLDFRHRICLFNNSTWTSKRHLKFKMFKLSFSKTFSSLSFLSQSTVILSFQLFWSKTLVAFLIPFSFLPHIKSIAQCHWCYL